MEIIIPDLGHGNCVGFFDDDNDPFIVDCGCSTYSKIDNFENKIFSRINSCAHSNTILVITHYHSDHYNLIQLFADNFFKETYVPKLPSYSSTANVILKFLSLATIFNYKDYYLSSYLIKKSRDIKCLEKGSIFTALNYDWEVIWPDYSIIDDINQVTVNRVEDKIGAIIGELSREENREFKDVYEYLSRAYSQYEPEYENFPKYEWTKEISTDITDKFEKIERQFKTLANRASLVFHDFDGNYLFTGDVDGRCLNDYITFNENKYLLIETPHHGGYYGHAFDNVESHYLLISRKRSYKPNYEYFQKMFWNILIDTARMGNTIIRPNFKTFTYDA